ncbi:OmpA family protein [Gymnodinialimonas sp. 57CJ19]|uniref:OmpA family protein n=1 Tax=Gymnodinialimonas sp. 57CJ19 TaxID=3138498 RepID=UPI0031345898
MAIFRKRMQQDMEHDDAGQRLAHASRRADHYRKLVATPSVLLAAGLFTVSGVAGGFLATGQTPRPMAALGSAAPIAPVAAIQPAVAPQTAPVVEDVADVAAQELPPVLETALELSQDAPEEEELVFTSLSVDAATGREERRAATRPVLTEAQAEICRENLQGAADRLSVRFSAGSTNAASEDMDAAYSFAEGVASCSGIRVMVRGHSDATGDETQNLLLSWERAESVIEAIAAAGHDTTYYEPIGFGSRQLLADTPAEQAQALSRRVEFAVVALRQ